MILRLKTRVLLLPRLWKKYNQTVTGAFRRSASAVMGEASNLIQPAQLWNGVHYA